MAGQPYNFAPDRVTSPFDRRPQSPFTSGQPPSFKTNINRNKTRKWVEAKAYNYDGDDWGDYDEDDEYGVAAHASTAPQPPAAFRKRGLSIGKNGQPRSFTEPSVAPGEPSSARRNSFEQGDEKRAFSASNAMPQSPPRINTTVLGGDVQPSANTMTVSPSVYSPATPATGPSTHHQPPHDATSQSRQSSWNQSVASDSSLFMDPHQRRDFEQSFLPQPLQMRGASPAPTSAPDPAAAQHFPPRKSSLSSPTDQRRPSFPQSDTHDASQASSTQATNTPEILAQANRQLPEPEVGPTGDAQLQHQPSLGFRSAVRDAFYRPDDNSVPPTPISKTDSLGTGASEVTRSDTTSTAGISPIMSRVPSGARPGGKKGKEPDYSHPSIAEEPGSRPVSIGTIRQVNRKPSPSTYNPETVPRVSTPTGRRNLGTPSPSHSPARSPAIAPAQNLPEPEAADLGMASPADADPASPKNFLTREADLASPSRSSGRTSQDAGAELRHAQTSFLEHRQSLSLDTSAPTSPISASESPTKGRVRDIANRLNADSRRNSTQSVTSVKSSGSGSKLHRSRSTSPVKRLPNDARPKPERASTFRPQLPGTWESFNTSVSDPATPSEAKSELDLRTPARPASTKTGQGPLEETDITPTTSKRPLDHKDAVDPAANPMGALAAAGAAMGEALKSAVGAGEKSEPQSWENSAASSAENLPVEEEKKDRSVGDVYLRPLQLDRKASSIESDSSVPPSPPADEQQTPSVEEEIRMPLPLKSREPSVHSEGEFLSARRPDIVTQLSTEPASYDTESDRLRKEIVARLSTPSLASENAEGARALSLSAQAAGPEGRTASPNNRVSIAIPTEYGDYWARYGDDDSLDRMPTHDSTHSAAAAPEHTVRPTMPDRSKTSTGSESTGAHNPLVKRFSWEQDSAATTPSAGAAPRVTLPTTELPAASKSPPTNQSSQEPDRSGNRASIAQAIAEMPDGRPISADGLHIINPEPESDSDVAELEAPAAPAQPHQPPGDLSLAASLEPALSATQTPPPASPAPTTPQAKVPLFREILALKSCDERVAKYNETREQFANMETGLRNWISSTLEKKPEHSHLISLPTQPLPPLTSGGGGGLGGMRHKHNKSLTTGLRKGSGMQGQFLDSSAANSAGSPTGQQVTSPGAPANKMQSKGKDLLKGAGVLGGKGMKEARGFFSKGRSKWRGSGADSKAQRASAPLPLLQTQPPPTTAASTDTATTAPAPTSSSLAGDETATTTTMATNATGATGATAPAAAVAPPAVALSVPSVGGASGTAEDERKERDEKKEKKKKRFSSSFGRLRDRVRERSKSRGRRKSVGAVAEELKEEEKEEEKKSRDSAVPVAPAAAATAGGASGALNGLPSPVKEVGGEEQEQEQRDRGVEKAADGARHVSSAGVTALGPEREQGEAKMRDSEGGVNGEREGEREGEITSAAHRETEDAAPAAPADDPNAVHETDAASATAPPAAARKSITAETTRSALSATTSVTNEDKAGAEAEADDERDCTARPRSTCSRPLSTSSRPLSTCSRPRSHCSRVVQKRKSAASSLLGIPLDEVARRRSGSLSLSLDVGGFLAGEGGERDERGEEKQDREQEHEQEHKLEDEIAGEGEDEKKEANGVREQEQGSEKEVVHVQEQEEEEEEREKPSHAEPLPAAPFAPAVLHQTRSMSPLQDISGAVPMSPVSPIEGDVGSGGVGYGFGSFGPLVHEREHDRELVPEHQPEQQHSEPEPEPEPKAPAEPEAAKEPEREASDKVAMAPESESEAEDEAHASDAPLSTRDVAPVTGGFVPVQPMRAQELEAEQAQQQAQQEQAQLQLTQLQQLQPETRGPLQIQAERLRMMAEARRRRDESAAGATAAGAAVVVPAAVPVAVPAAVTAVDAAGAGVVSVPVVPPQQRMVVPPPGFRGPTPPGGLQGPLPQQGFRGPTPPGGFQGPPPQGFQGPPPQGYRGPTPPGGFQGPSPQGFQPGQQRMPPPPQRVVVHQGVPPGMRPQPGVRTRPGVRFGAPPSQPPPPGQQQQQANDPYLIDAEYDVPGQRQSLFTRQDFDPRSYGIEYTLPGVGPPTQDFSRNQQKRRSLLLGNRSSASVAARGGASGVVAPDRINPQHVAGQEDQLHRAFSYQSSGDREKEREKEETKRSRSFLPFRRQSSGGEVVTQEPEKEKETKKEEEKAREEEGKKSQRRNLLQRNHNAAAAAAAAATADKHDEKEKPKPKKKRFSSLGSLFGRSASSPAVPQQKQQQQEEEQEHRLRKADSKGRLHKTQPPPHASQASLPPSAAMQQDASSVPPVPPVPPVPQVPQVPQVPHLPQLPPPPPRDAAGQAFANVPMIPPHLRGAGDYGRQGQGQAQRHGQGQGQGQGQRRSGEMPRQQQQQQYRAYNPRVVQQQQPQRPQMQPRMPSSSSQRGSWQMQQQQQQQQQPQRPQMQPRMPSSSSQRGSWQQQQQQAFQARNNYTDAPYGSMPMPNAPPRGGRRYYAEGQGPGRANQEQMRGPPSQMQMMPGGGQGRNQWHYQQQQRPLPPALSTGISTVDAAAAAAWPLPSPQPVSRAATSIAAAGELARQVGRGDGAGAGGAGNGTGGAGYAGYGFGVAYSTPEAEPTLVSPVSVGVGGGGYFPGAGAGAVTPPVVPPKVRHDEGYVSFAPYAPGPPPPPQQQQELQQQQQQQQQQRPYELSLPTPPEPQPEPPQEQQQQPQQHPSHPSSTITTPTSSFSSAEDTHGDPEKEAQNALLIQQARLQEQQRVVAGWREVLPVNAHAEGMEGAPPAYEDGGVLGQQVQGQGQQVGGGGGVVREGAGVSSEQRQRHGDEDAPVVMHGASYPGMEWEPRWDGEGDEGEGTGTLPGVGGRR